MNTQSLKWVKPRSVHTSAGLCTKRNWQLRLSAVGYCQSRSRQLYDQWRKLQLVMSNAAAVLDHNRWRIWHLWLIYEIIYTVCIFSFSNDNALIIYVHLTQCCYIQISTWLYLLCFFYLCVSSLWPLKFFLKSFTWGYIMHPCLTIFTIITPLILIRKGVKAPHNLDSLNIADIH